MRVVSTRRLKRNPIDSHLRRHLSSPVTRLLRYIKWVLHGHALHDHSRCFTFRPAEHSRTVSLTEKENVRTDPRLDIWARVPSRILGRGSSFYRGKRTLRVPVYLKENVGEPHIDPTRSFEFVPCLFVESFLSRSLARSTMIFVAPRIFALETFEVLNQHVFFFFPSRL